MVDVLIAYLAVGCFFLMIELITSTFFGLSLAIASFVLAGYVWLSGDQSFTAIQLILYIVISTMLLALFPRILKKADHTPEYPIGVKAFVGKDFTIKTTPRGNLCVEIEGVSYLLVDEESFREGQRVTLTSYEGSKVQVASKV